MNLPDQLLKYVMNLNQLLKHIMNLLNQLL
jgi:hypothetical protein